MQEIDKLRVMLPHWIEHNHGHEAEFLRWAEALAPTAPVIADLLRTAAAALQSAQRSLNEALTKAGGPPPAPRHSGGHHH
jgi:hypothetical protein